MKLRHLSSTTTPEEDPLLPVHATDSWLTRLLSLPSDLVRIGMASIISVVSQSYRKAEETKDSVESAVHVATDHLPSEILGGGAALVKKVGMGLVGATYVCMVLMAAMAVAAAVGVGLVRSWVEEPVFVRDRLYFDYTEPHPMAVFWLGDGGGFGGVHDEAVVQMKNNMGVPVGHTFQVSLLLLMPDSSFNREIGIFQLRTELLSGNMNVIAKSSQPCMLRYTSLPIRLTRIFAKLIPILLGISRESQTMTFQMLKHKEGYPRTEAVRVTLIPRAGAQYNLPQLYEAEIIISSQLPWVKQVVHNWKWTFYVWASLYLYTMFLLFMICCCKPILFPKTTSRLSTVQYGERNVTVAVRGEGGDRVVEEREVSEISMVRTRRQSRNKRKATYMQESSVSSLTVTGVQGDEVGDSESVI